MKVGLRCPKVENNCVMKNKWYIVVKWTRLYKSATIVVVLDPCYIHNVYGQMDCRSIGYK